MFTFKNKTNNKYILEKLIVNLFYFLTALLVLALISELLVSGLFELYFNSAAVAILWLLSALALLLYVRR